MASNIAEPKKTRYTNDTTNEHLHLAIWPTFHQHCWSRIVRSSTKGNLISLSLSVSIAIRSPLAFSSQEKLWMGRSLRVVTDQAQRHNEEIQEGPKIVLVKQDQTSQKHPMSKAVAQGQFLVVMDANMEASATVDANSIRSRRSTWRNFPVALLMSVCDMYYHSKEIVNWAGVDGVVYLVFHHQHKDVSFRLCRLTVSAVSVPEIWDLLRHAEVQSRVEYWV